MTNIGPATKGTFVYLTSPDGRRTVRSWVKVSIGDVWLPLSGGETCTWSDIVKYIDSASNKDLRIDIEEAASAEELAKANAIIDKIKKALEGVGG